MRTYENRYMLVCTALALMILSVGTMASTGYRQNEQQYDDPMQQQSQYQGQTQQRQTEGMESRNPQLERQVARQLRQQGFGEESQILILATGNRLILLGSVPDEDTKEQIEQTARQTAQGSQLDNRLVVSEDTERRSGEQLQQSIQQEIRGIQPEMAQNIQVQASNGKVLLRGQVDSWMHLADAIEAAFSAGAQEVTSQLQVTGADQFAMRQDPYGRQQQMDQQQRGAYPPLGYTPGQEDQIQQQTGTRRATASDLILAHRIALEIQQQLNLRRAIQVADPQAIYIMAHQGTVTLYGSVQDRSQIQQIQQIVQGIRGVQNVRSELHVAGEGRGDQTLGYIPGQNGQQQTGRQQEMGQQQSRQGQPTMGQQQSRQQMSASDRRLAQQVEQQLKQQLPDADINVSASEGTITLQGSVRQQNQKQQAEQIAKSVSGVQNITNDITVGEGDLPPLGYTPGQNSQSRQQTSRQQGQPRQQATGQQRQQTTGQQTQQMSASDRRLAQQVEQQLQQQLPDADINVSASQGTVTLQGSVQQQNQKQQAEQIAKSVSGVQDIRNNISVGEGQFPALGYTPGQNGQMQQPTGRQQTMGQQMSSADFVLSHRVALELQEQLPGDRSVFVVDPQAIYVVASQGTVMLYGSVQDRNQIQQIERIARNVQGVQNIQNQLNVAGQPMTGQQMTGRQTGQQQQMSASDKRLAQQVEQQLQQRLPDTNINVTASQGTVTLQGSVRQQNQKQQAEQIAKSVNGVRNIQNNITVGAAGGEYPPLGFIPGQEDQAQQETGISGDQRCIQMLKQGLSDQDLGAAVQDVYVTCHNGEMALYGYVRSEDEKDRLERATKQIEGIDEVDNNIVVREEGWEQKSDAEIKEDVESQLWWSPFVDSDNIQVSVQNGTVTLSGQVDDWDAEKAAIKNAFDGGARRVRSQLQVQDQTDQEDSMRTSEQDRVRTGQSRDDESGMD